MLPSSNTFVNGLAQLDFWFFSYPNFLGFIWISQNRIFSILLHQLWKLSFLNNEFGPQASRKSLCWIVLGPEAIHVSIVQGCTHYHRFLQFSLWRKNLENLIHIAKRCCDNLFFYWLKIFKIWIQNTWFFLLQKFRYVLRLNSWYNFWFNLRHSRLIFHKL